MLVYRLLFLHGLLLMLGGHYTYARVPLGFWVQDLLDLTRNHYDRLGHLAQGFIPALLVREILVKKLFLPQGPLVVPHRLQHLPGLQRLLRIRRMVGGPARRRLGGSVPRHPGGCLGYPVGHVLALVGAILAQLLLSGQHDRELGKLYCCRQVTVAVKREDGAG